MPSLNFAFIFWCTIDHTHTHTHTHVGVTLLFFRNEIEVSFRDWLNAKMKKCGVHVLVEEPNVM